MTSFAEKFVFALVGGLMLAGVLLGLVGTLNLVATGRNVQAVMLILGGLVGLRILQVAGERILGSLRIVDVPAETDDQEEFDDEPRGEKQREWF